MKASGVVAGIPDCILVHQGRCFGFEFKTINGKVSSVQEKVHKVWQEDGTPVYIIRTIEEFKLNISAVIGTAQERKVA